MLSIGALTKIHQGVDISDPVLQVLGYKAIPGSDPPRFRLHISDGQFSTSDAILATNLNHLIIDQCLDKFSIVQVTKLVCNEVTTKPNKLVLILLEVVVLTPGAKSAAGLAILCSWSLITRSLLLLGLPVPTATNTTIHLSQDLVVQPGHELAHHLLKIAVF